MDPQEPQGYIKYASVYRKRSPELSVQMLEKLRTVDPSYPVDAEAGHFFYTANKFQDAVKYYGKVDLNQLKDNYLTEFATAEYLLADSKKSLEVSLFGANKNPRSAAMNRIPNWLKWLVVALVFALMGAAVLAVDRRASRVDMPDPDNTFGIYREADA